MKKLLMVLVLFVSAVCFIGTAEAKYSLITAIRVYGPGEFAVKGLIEEQAKAMIKSWTKKPSRILVEGSADKKGDAAFNDKIGKLRADEMKAFLETRFPDANIIARSLGDQMDVRQVQISVEFETDVMAQAPGIKSPKKDQGLNIRSLVLGFVAMLFLFTVIVALLLRDRSNRKSSKLGSIANGRQRKVLVTADPNAKEVECFGYVTKVRRVQREDKRVWELPFRHVRDDGSLGEKIWNENFRKLLSSLARCYMPDSKFASQIPGLILSGDIRKI